MIMACMGGHADVLKVLVEEFGMSTDISDFVSQFMYSLIKTYFPTVYIHSVEMGVCNQSMCIDDVALLLLLLY